MQSITIGKPDEYLRLTAVRWPSDGAPEHVPREKRRYLQAELRIRKLTATSRLDLHQDYAGLVQFFDQAVATWRDWNNSSAVWGLSSGMRLELVRGPRPALGPDHFVLWIKLQDGGGFRHRPWTVETTLVLSPEELDAIARDLHRLTD
ncbi:hypothetical protein EV649_2400 [Kribbella sp. VKM Ac-2569]|uniref:hypothetical protein n=1 Tax=Kribbella sp. VKM Ac-2569 TaxID=2512220 RepID=UPI00102AED34|nr:hypothetical protein [Kribbella sp. VKM Ac-2569]RZT28617.1 hypothetical protein EV649_2400 [Kribbella sp. VKM Ac-2569]